MRYWIYKCNTQGGPAGDWGDWASDVFAAEEGRPVGPFQRPARTPCTDTATRTSVVKTLSSPTRRMGDDSRHVRRHEDQPAATTAGCG